MNRLSITENSELDVCVKIEINVNKVIPIEQNGMALSYNITNDVTLILNDIEDYYEIYTSGSDIVTIFIHSKTYEFVGSLEFRETNTNTNFDESIYICNKNCNICHTVNERYILNMSTECIKLDKYVNVYYPIKIIKRNVILESKDRILQSNLWAQK